jgi:hypothetical protein
VIRTSISLDRHWAGRGLAWTALLTIMLLSVFMLQAVVAAIPTAPGSVTPRTACQSLTPGTAALTDGDDVRARALSRLDGDPWDPYPSPDVRCNESTDQDAHKRPAR